MTAMLVRSCVQRHYMERYLEQQANYGHPAMGVPMQAVQTGLEGRPVSGRPVYPAGGAHMYPAAHPVAYPVNTGYSGGSLMGTGALGFMGGMMMGEALARPHYYAHDTYVHDHDSDFGGGDFGGGDSGGADFAADN